MGCDIHLYVERKHKEKGWVPVDPPTKMPEGADSKTFSIWFEKGYFEDWGSYTEKDSALKTLGDAGKSLADIIPETANEWNFGRDYDAFGELARVRRTEHQPPIDPRGVPDDISAHLFPECWMEDDKYHKRRSNRVTERDGKTWYWHPDWHTPHWYSLSEVRRFVKDGSLSEGRVRELLKELRKVAKTYGLTGEQLRVVFWFDN